jgi:pimeloyl-ACP methyl ester carboxylesterase
MPRLVSYDGTELAYRLTGNGRPLVCVPGGPGCAAEYLGDLGGLSAYRQLVLLDNRGTGRSAVPADPGTYRADRLVDDVEALRVHLGLERLDLLGHSAGASVTIMYAARFPTRLESLAYAGYPEIAIAAGPLERHRVGPAGRGTYQDGAGVEDDPDIGHSAAVAMKSRNSCQSAGVVRASA